MRPWGKGVGQEPYPWHGSCSTASATGYHVSQMAFTAPIDDVSEPTPSGCDLVLDEISHRYGAGLAVDHVSLEISGGELLALLGPSGPGKTPLFRTAAGFAAQTAARVVIAGEPVDGRTPNRREVGIVFQNYALFPH